MADDQPIDRTRSITIVDTTIPILEYKDQRVITLAMMDKIHHRPDGTAGRNFREHKEKFEEGKHYYHIDSKELKSFDEFRRMGAPVSPQGIILLTERGYSMLVKAFSDDLAWEVQDQLVDSYFDTKAPMSTAEFLVQQAKLILDHEHKIKRLEQRQNASDKHLAETRAELQVTSKRVDEAFEAASAALRHKHGGTNYFTIVGYCNDKGIKVTTEEAKAMGAQASQLSRAKEREVLKIPDERWGKVNAYHVSILEEVFKGRKE